MKLNLTATLFAITLSLSVFSQDNNTDIPQNYEDSLTLAKTMVDKMDKTKLVKQREHLVYLSKENSYKGYTELLVYIEERIKTLSK